MKLKTCDDYMQSPELQAMYDGLSNEEKEKLASLTDNDGVILTEKLAYMVYLAEYYSTPATAETYMSISPIAGSISCHCHCLLIINFDWRLLLTPKEKIRKIETL